MLLRYGCLATALVACGGVASNDGVDSEGTSGGTANGGQSAVSGTSSGHGPRGHGAGGALSSGGARARGGAAAGGAAGIDGGASAGSISEAGSSADARSEGGSTAPDSLPSGGSIGGPSQGGVSGFSAFGGSLALGGVSAVGGSSMQAPYCGDGIVQQGEVCDAGTHTGIDGCSADCQIANCLVPVSHPSIQVAHDDASCSSVWLLPGVYTENLKLTRDIHIIGESWLGPVAVVSAGPGEPVVTILKGQVWLENFSIANGITATHGAGITNAGSLKLSNMGVGQNTVQSASARGGGIYSTGPVQILDSAVGDNVALADPTLAAPGVPAAAEGGGIYMESGSLVISEGSYIVANRAEVVTGQTGVPGCRGGGIFARGDVHITEGSSILSNSVGRDAEFGYGGGVYIEGSTLTVDAAANIRSNVANAADAEGGGVYLGSYAGAVLDAGAVISNNNLVGVTVARGAGIAADAASTHDISAHGSRFEQNYANAQGRAEGGGIALVNQGDGVSRLLLVDTSVRSNGVHAQTQASGGGVFLATRAVLARLDFEFVNSAAVANGAGDDGGPGATSFGGGIAASAAQGASDAALGLKLTNSTIALNYVEDHNRLGGGGAIALLSAAGALSAQLSSVTLYKNAALGLGGGLLARGSDTSTISIGLRNSLSAYNMDGDTLNDCAGDALVSSDGYNLLAAPLTCNITSAGPELYDPAPALGGLDETGDKPGTVPLLQDSVARDRGNPLGCTDAEGNLLDTDERGTPRHGRCDIGAFEY